MLTHQTLSLEICKRRPPCSVQQRRRRRCYKPKNVTLLSPLTSFSWHDRARAHLESPCTITNTWLNFDVSSDGSNGVSTQSLYTMTTMSLLFCFCFCLLLFTNVRTREIGRTKSRIKRSWSRYADGRLTRCVACERAAARHRRYAAAAARRGTLAQSHDTSSIRWFYVGKSIRCLFCLLFFFFVFILINKQKKERDKKLVITTYVCQSCRWRHRARHDTL